MGTLIIFNISLIYSLLPFMIARAFFPGESPAGAGWWERNFAVNPKRRWVLGLLIALELLGIVLFASYGHAKAARFKQEIQRQSDLRHRGSK